MHPDRGGGPARLLIVMLLFLVLRVYRQVHSWRLGWHQSLGEALLRSGLR